MRMPGNRIDSNITISVSIRITPGREADFEQYLQGITDAAEQFPGFQEVRAIRAGSGKRQYQVILRFKEESDLKRWRNSEERDYWNARAEDLAEGTPRIANITGTAQEQPLVLAITPLQSFVRTNVSGIGLLLLGTIIALVMANSRFSDTYQRLWDTHVTIGSTRYGLDESLRHWVNDGLMALFFFIVGLEIKREILVGELRYLRQAALPISAAIGGAVVPALLFLVLNLGSDASIGWGVPIGTDTAFSLGILSILGARVRPELLLFLTAFAIIDDILAVGVIAIFYTDSIDWNAVGVAALFLGALVLANRMGFQRWPVYAVLGLGVWLAIFQSGIHGTFAGVLVAITVPSRAWINPSDFLNRGRSLLDAFEKASSKAKSVLSNEGQQHVAQRLGRLCQEVETPLTHLEHGLNPYVSYAVLPLFAFANAGIPLTSGLGDAMQSPVTWGVILGLVIGKPVGILLFSWIAVRTKIAIRSEGIAWQQVIGVGFLGGIGFTMSLFIAELAFGRGPTADAARVGILFGSVIAGGIGYLMLVKTLPAGRSIG